MSNPTDTIALQVEFTYVPNSKPQKGSHVLPSFPDPHLSHKKLIQPFPFFSKKVAVSKCSSPTKENTTSPCRARTPPADTLPPSPS
ncbi:hypothetical protein D0863_14164 [Hortaea werneckii]|uniref:Uncharacterized protein n=1 Tax=Hortaea werneckii TaxID=91943 RepID=A0A3M7CL59_HORWE|nr:hypothetical protein D0863_14164 [Hortaea werneckii]